MEENILQITDNLYLSAPGTQPGDIDALVLYLNDEEVTDNLNTLPSPYTEESAKAFFEFIEKERQALGQLHIWSIRDKNMRLIGGIGIHPKDSRDQFAADGHKAEIGYWLAPEHWNKGYMKKAITFYTQHVFANFPQVVKIYGNVFTKNQASARVLERCGFVWEGTLKNQYLKNGALIDSFFYALMRE